MQWAAALHSHLKMPGLDKDGYLCGAHPSWDHSSSNATWPLEGMAARKGMRNCLLKAVGNIRDTGQVPLFLASQLLAVLLRSKGRCHPPQINDMLLFLSFWHSFISSPVPYMQAQTSSVLKFPTNYLLTKLEQPKLLEDFWEGEEGRGLWGPADMSNSH